MSDRDRRPWRTVEETGLPEDRRLELARILHARDRALTVKELVPLMPAYRRVYEWPCPEPHQHDDAEECIHARQTYVWRPAYANVYADLRILERERKVMPHRMGGRTLWKAYDQDDEEAEAILSIMAAMG